jgi:hypothetical protein
MLQALVDQVVAASVATTGWTICVLPANSLVESVGCVGGRFSRRQRDGLWDGKSRSNK